MLKFFIMCLALLIAAPPSLYAGFAFNENTGDTAATSTTLVEHVQLDSTHGITTSDWLILYSVGNTVDSDAGGLSHVSFEKNDVRITTQTTAVEPENVATTHRIPSQWWHMCETCSSTDDFQIKGRSSGTLNTTFGQGGIVGIDIGSLSKDTNWVIGAAENGTDDESPASTATYLDIESITIPSGNSGEVWLIFARFLMDFNATGEGRARLELDDTTAIYQDSNWDAEDFGASVPFLLFHIYTVPDGDAHTFDIQFYTPDVNTNIFNANIIGINTDELTTVFDFEQSETNETNNSTTYADYTVAAKNMNFSSTGDYLVMGWNTGTPNANNDREYLSKLLFEDTSSHMERNFEGSTSADDDRKMSLHFTVQTVSSTGTKGVDTQFKSSQAVTEVTIYEGGVFMMLEESDAAVGSILRNSTIRNATITGT